MKEYLFSYGTLQQENVQRQSFGRILKGEKDTLTGFTLQQLEITDTEVLALSQEKFHPIAIQTNDKNDVILGTLYEVSEEELQQADNYEVSDYKRIQVIFKSGKKGWVYVKN